MGGPSSSGSPTVTSAARPAADSTATHRQSRPMTIADLHFALEREQEAVVNRLTRELSILRSQSAPTTSTASSSPSSLNDPIDYAPQYSNGLTTSRRHRSSSSLSIHNLSTAGSGASIAPSRDSTLQLQSKRPSGEFIRNSRSREPSITSTQSSICFQGEHVTSPHFHVHSHSHNSSISAPRQSTTTPITGSAHCEETVQQRAELDAVKKENEQLRRRVQQLEQSLRVCYNAFRDGHADSATSTANSPFPKMKVTPLTAALWHFCFGFLPPPFQFFLFVSFLLVISILYQLCTSSSPRSYLRFDLVSYSAEFLTYGIFPQMEKLVSTVFYSHFNIIELLSIYYFLFFIFFLSWLFCIFF